MVDGRTGVKVTVAVVLRAVNRGKGAEFFWGGGGEKGHEATEASEGGRR